MHQHRASPYEKTYKTILALKVRNIEGKFLNKPIKF